MAENIELQLAKALLNEPAVNVEILSAKTLLDEGADILIPAPFLFRLVGKKYYKAKIKTPYAGTALKILKLRLSIGVTDDELTTLTVDQAFALQTQHSVKVAQMVALGILRERRLLKKTYSRLLAYYLLKVKTFDELLDYMTIICLGSGVEAFTTSIRLTRFLRLTASNLSQTTQKS